MATGPAEHDRDDEPGPIRQSKDDDGEQHDADRPPPGNVGRTEPFEEAETLDRAVGPTHDERSGEA